MKKFLKNTGKTFLMYALIFIILIASYMILMTMVSLIPSSVIEDNVRKSSETLKTEGEQVTYDLKYKKEKIFTFTDALMINTAYSIDSKNPIDSFLLARKNYIPGQTKIVYHDSQYNLGANYKYKNARTGDLYQTQELYGLMHGDKIEDSYEYARYWHGYLVILRPLLALFDYHAIRIVLAIITLICVAVLLFLLYKKVNIAISIIFAIGLFSISIWVVTQSINEILIFLVAFISTIILLLKYKKMKRIGIFFFVVGSISSFIDLLTAPLVTLGINTIVYFLLLQQKQKPDIKVYFEKMFEIVASWGLGYGLTWAAKWIIIELCFENRPMISQVITQIAFRSELPVNNGKAIISRWSIIKKNLNFLSKPTIIIVVSMIIILVVFLRIKNRKRTIDIKSNLKRCVPYLTTFFLPIAWFVAITQHSYVHAFFVYRILIISIISLLLIIYNIFETKKEEKI